MTNLLERFRERRGLTVEQLGELCGLSKSYMSQIINGKSCSLATAKRIHQVTGVAPDKLPFMVGQSQSVRLRRARESA